MFSGFQEPFGLFLDSYFCSSCGEQPNVLGSVPENQRELLYCSRHFTVILSQHRSTAKRQRADFLMLTGLRET